MTRRRSISPLTKKLIRDLKSGWKSFMAIFIICATSIMLYVGIDACWRGMEKNLEDQFNQGRLADLWVKGSITDRTARDIAAIDGVESAQRRVTVRMKAKDLAGEPKLLLLMNDGEPTVNMPLVFEGEPLSGLPKNYCVLQERFAAAHGLKVGDVLHLTFSDRVLDLTIGALGYMPEYVVASDGGELAQSAANFGYACVSQGTLSYLPYSEVIVRLESKENLSSVKREVENLLKDTRLVVNERTDILGVKMATEQAGQIRSIGTIFPLVFFIIAVLITWTTMGRLVEKQRLQIGSLFALGYGRGELIWHYASYGLLLSVAGSVVGFIGAQFGIAEVIFSFLGALYAMPGVTPFLSPWVVVSICLLMMVITGGAAVLSAVSALNLTPAALLRPKPPGKGKRVFLENIRIIWNRMGFSNKMILRNMLRNPVRLLMGMIGALGCAALMLTGFGLRDSMSYVMLSHYSDTMRYDARVTLLNSVQADYGRAVALRANAEIFNEEMITGCEIYTEGEWKMKPVYVLEDDQDMVWLLDERAERVILPDMDAALSKKASEDYGIALGDELLMRMPGGRAVSVTVRQIVDLHLDQGVYMSRSAWEKARLAPWLPTAVLLKGDQLDLATVENMDGVDKVRTIVEERSASGRMLQVMTLVVLVLVLFSGVLALVVFYNLGQLNFSERIRELATLKVLGFTPKEIKKLVLRENIIITCLGLALSLIFGPMLHEVVLVSALPDNIQYIPYIAPDSWVITVVMTLAFAMVVNWMLGSKFKNVDMVEALKSVE